MAAKEHLAVAANGKNLPQIAPTTRSALQQVIQQAGPLKGKSAVPILTFIVLRAAGWHASRAYKFIRPHVTDRSAQQLGSVLARSHAQHIDALRLNPALTELAMADLTPIRIMLDPQASSRDALTAADQINRRYGRYQPDAASVNVFTTGDALLSHLNDAPKPIELPADTQCDDAEV